MDCGKADHPAPIIPPSNLSNDANPATAYSTPISILTAVLARQVKVIDDSSNISNIVSFHNIFFIEKFSSHPPIFTQIL